MLERTFASAVNPLIASPLAALALAMSATPAKAETVTLELRNGDKIKGILVESESNETVKVLIHPDLGKMTIQSAALKQPRKSPWAYSLAAGFNGANAGEEFSAGGSLSASASYKRNKDKFDLKGTFQYEKTRKSSDTTAQVNTNKGGVTAEYSRELSKRLGATASSQYLFNTLLESGTSNLTSSVGLTYNIFKSKKLLFRLSAGPSLQQVWGGVACSAKPDCGRSYGGGQLGAKLEWKPSKYFVFTLNNAYNAAIRDSGVASSNVLSGGLKVYPTGKESIFGSLSAQTRYSQLQDPTVNNSVVFQIGTEIK